MNAGHFIHPRYPPTPVLIHMSLPGKQKEQERRILVLGVQGNSSSRNGAVFDQYVVF